MLRELSHAQKTAKGAPAYSRFVNRRAGRYLAAAAYQTGRTPNQVTAASAASSAAAIALVALVPPSAVLGVAVALLLALGYALDSADGQLARLRGGGSPAGEWLDHVVDCIKCSGLHVAVLICWFRYFDLPDAALLLIPLIFGLQYSVFFFTIILTEQLRRASVGINSSSRPKTNEPA